MASNVTIDLAGIGSKGALLTRLETALEFGGPEGNRAPEGRGWGRKWDALTDCLCYLGSGGIRGTSSTLEFPINLSFINTKEFEVRCPKEFSIFEEILKDVQTIYRRHGKEFTYTFVDTE